MQCHSCNRTLSDVVCSEDANDKGEGDGCNEFHDRISRGRKCSRRPKRGHRSSRLQHGGTDERGGLPPDTPSRWTSERGWMHRCRHHRRGTVPWGSRMVSWVCCSWVYCRSIEDVTRLEGDSLSIVHDVPSEVFLKHAVGSTVAELIDQSVQTGLSGVRLPTAVKDPHPCVGDLCNLVSMESDGRDAADGLDTGVGVGPVLACVDSGVHLGFDLTHDVVG